MNELTRSIFLQALQEWGDYVPGFHRLSADEQSEFLKEQGYACLRDLLAHISVWWEETESVVRDTLEQREHPRMVRDFDAFNAQAVQRFQSTPEVEFLTWFESMRQKMISLVSGLTDEQLKVRRIRTWLSGTILSHLKEHNLAPSRFILNDMLEREWAEYLDQYNAMPPERQDQFLEKQGYSQFRDLIGHIIAWWEEGLRAIRASGDYDPCAEQDVDGFNAQAVERFRKIPAEQVWAAYHRTRLELKDLIAGLSQEVFLKPEVQSWLESDVIGHYYEHGF